MILSAFVVSVARGDGPEAQWLLLGPMPFWLIGLIGYLRQPGRPVVWWLVGVGVAFGCSIALGDVFLPLAAEHWGSTSSVTAAIALLNLWLAVAAPVAGGMRACAAEPGPEATDPGIAPALPSRNSAIVTFLSQLSFAIDTPIDGGFHGKECAEQPPGRVS